MRHESNAGKGAESTRRTPREVLRGVRERVLKVGDRIIENRILSSRGEESDPLGGISHGSINHDKLPLPGFNNLHATPVVTGPEVMREGKPSALKDEDIW